MILLPDDVDPNDRYSYNEQQIEPYDIFTDANHDQDLGLKVRRLKDLRDTVPGSSIAVMSYNS